jgi:hypothetical protein
VSRPASAALAALIVLVIAAPASADGDVLIDWAHTPPLSGTVEDDAVVITAGPGGGSFPLTVIEAPPVGAPGYAVVGRVSYEDVEGQGFLEMWSVFPGGVRAFTRTLGTEGPMAALSGTAGWREFSLPFRLREIDGVPSSLEIGVVLPGAGSVRIGPLRLVSQGAPATEDGAWWSSRTAGIAGAAGGTLIGVLGALLGSLAARERSRRFVLAVMTALAVSGAGLTIAGVVAVAVSQPFAVWFTLLLPGLLLLAIFGTRIRGVRRSYAEAELRRIRAMDRA